MTAPPPPSTLVVGPETFLAERAVARVVTAARAHDPAVERVDVDAGLDTAAGQLADALAPTLFGGGSVVVVANVESADDDAVTLLLDAVADVPPGMLLVAVHAGGQKGRGVADRLRRAVAEVVAVERLKGRAVDEFCVREITSSRRTATTEAVAALRSAVGDDLRSLAAACSQLAVDIEADPIDAVDVAEYYDGVAGVKAYEVADAMWAADPERALVALRWALERDPSYHPAVVATVAGGLRSMMRFALAPHGMRPNDLAREVGVPAWKLNALRTQLQQWPRPLLARATLLLAAADVAVKGGSDGEGLDPVQKHLVLERTVMGIATSRRPRPD